MEQREQNDNKHSERKQHINAVIKRSDAMRKTERDIRSNSWRKGTKKRVIF